MFKKYLKIALRNLVRHKVLSVVQLLGLIVALSFSFVIVLFIWTELSYDKFYKNADRIYRVIDVRTFAGQMSEGVGGPMPLAPTLTTYFSEIECATRVMHAQVGNLVVNNQSFEEKKIFLVDSSFFKIFSCEFLYGNTFTALSEPDGIVITEEVAEKYFGRSNVLGQLITSPATNKTFHITGIMKKVPINSHFHFDILAPLVETDFEKYNVRSSWNHFLVSTYILLSSGANSLHIAERSADCIKPHLEYASQPRKIRLQKLTDIHLYSHLNGEFEVNGDSQNVLLFFIVGLLILALSSMNYINLSVARVIPRMREIGIRKAVGVKKYQLTIQFLVEAIVQSLIATAMAIGILQIILPIFSQLFQRDLVTIFSIHPEWVLGFIVIGIFIGGISGLYPAFVLASQKPSIILREASSSGKFNLFIRKLVLVVQFVISIGLIVCTLIIHQQINFLLHKDLGFNKTGIVYVKRIPKTIADNYEAVKTQLLQDPHIKSVTSGAPLGIGYLTGTTTYYDNGMLYELNFIDANYDYVATMGLQLTAGRDYSRDYPSDINEAYLLNETAVRQFQMTDPIGKTIKQFNGYKQKIIGVIKDFHIRSLRDPIPPLCIQLNRNAQYGIIVKIDPEALSQTMQHMNNVWKSFKPTQPMDYSFLEDDIAKQYIPENKLATLFNIFSFLAIFISCLGLFGIVSLMVEQQTKEIGIRKVLGAAVPQIVVMLTKDLMTWIMLANIIAWPIAYYVINKWLQNFAYKIEITWWVFVLSGGIALVIALLTVSYQAIRAARANPVEALRYE